MPLPAPSEVALAHHWLVSLRGGEAVLRELAGLFPGAPIHTLVKDESQLRGVFDGHPIHASRLQGLPGAVRRYKSMLPLFPWAIRGVRIDPYRRLLLSSDACVTKGIRKPPGCVHVCYCHSPPRYLWEMADVYTQHTSDMGWLKRKVFGWVAPRVREYDRRAAEGVDHFIANSHFIADRIRRCYGREADVVHPPAELHEFRPDQPREDFYLVVAALVSYKRIDLAVDACTRTGRRLVVIGGGDELEELQRRAGPTVTVLGPQPWDQVKSHFERCRAFLMPGIEDYGITPVEAQASGAPVIAYGAGGVLETVLEGQTGLFFQEQTVESLIAALDAFESGGLASTPEACRSHAEGFSPEAFRRGITAVLEKRLAEA